MKLKKTKNKKIVFCSRQSSELTLDYQMIIDRLKAEDPDVEIITICHRIGKGLSAVKFMGALLKSMHHLANARVCIIDAYWPAVSMLNHKKDLTVIQLWHAIGKIKKSGYAAVGKKGGRKAEYAKTLHMHENYDYIIAGGKAWNKYYVESFHCDEKVLLNYGLPRIDYLIETQEENINKLYDKYAYLKDKRIILYAPTFRRNMEGNWHPIVEAVKGKDIELVIKLHPREMGADMSFLKGVPNISLCPEISTMEIMAAAEAVITDYSAIALEAACLNKKVYWWLYDYEDYMANNGINLDPFREVPKASYKDIVELINDVEKGEEHGEWYQEFRKNYLPEDLGHSTEKICKLIESKLQVK